MASSDLDKFLKRLDYESDTEINELIFLYNKTKKVIEVERGYQIEEPNQINKYNLSLTEERDCEFMSTQPFREMTGETAGTRFTEDMKFEGVSIKPKEVVLPKLFRRSCAFCKSSYNLRRINGGLNKDGQPENCTQMLMSCFYIKLIDQHYAWLCEMCVSRLKDAVAFRRQVETAGDLVRGQIPTNNKSAITKPKSVDLKAEDVYIIEDDSLDAEFDRSSITNTEQEQEDNLKLPESWENWEEFNRLPWSEDECSIREQKDNKRIEWIHQPQFPIIDNKRLILSKDSTQCPTCDEFFPTRLDLIEHLETHVPKQLCEYCGKQYAFLTSLLQHLNYHIGTLPCPQCSRKFIKKDELLKHIHNLHNKDRTFPCSDCDDVFASRLLKKQHEFKKHGVWYNRHACPECDREFVNGTRLRIHVRRIHLAEKTVECPQCNRKFFNRTALSKHSFSHSDVRNFSCDLCDKAFKNKKHLRTHLDMHYNIRKYKCTICEQAFIQWTSLKVHMKSRHTPSTKIKK